MCNCNKEIINEILNILDWICESCKRAIDDINLSGSSSQYMEFSDIQRYLQAIRRDYCENQI